MARHSYRSSCHLSRTENRPSWLAFSWLWLASTSLSPSLFGDVRWWFCSVFLLVRDAFSSISVICSRNLSLTLLSWLTIFSETNLRFEKLTMWGTCHFGWSLEYNLIVLPSNWIFFVRPWAIAKLWTNQFVKYVGQYKPRWTYLFLFYFYIHRVQKKNRCVLNDILNAHQTFY